MTVIGAELRASYAFIERNFYLTRRTWAWEIAFLVYSVASALSISLIGVDQEWAAAMRESGRSAWTIAPTTSW